MKSFPSLIILSVLLLAPAACLAADRERPEELTRVMNMKGVSGETKHRRPQSARAKVLANTAHALGFQRGFDWRYKLIMTAVAAHEHDFDRIFNFAPLLINQRVLPPVIRWADKAVNIESDNFATEVEAQYRIIEPARIVSTPPSWRGYLEMGDGELNASPEISPNTSEEQGLWRGAVEEGWNEGMSHADEVFEMNMARLISDYRGILRFKMLSDKGLVSVPVLAEGNLGIQVGRDVLNVGQKTFRITVPAVFRAAEEQGR
jgi:defect-in-organelle-trafficking protein DotC